MRVQLSLLREYALLLGGAAILAGLMAFNVQGMPNPLALVRVALGLLYVLIVPGYLLQSGLFPRTEHLDALERVAFSLGLSIAIVPPAAFFLDYSGLGIDGRNIAVFGLIYTVVVGGWSAVRRWRTPAEARFLWASEVDAAGWWASQSALNRLLYRLLAGVLVVAVVASIAIVVLPKPATQFTEFYILGEQGLAESYPVDVVAGQEATVIFGITNREGRTMRYRVQARQGDQVIGERGPFDVASNERFERRLPFVALPSKEEAEVVFLLFREDDPQPYRSLRLWVKVAPSS